MDRSPFAATVILASAILFSASLSGSASANEASPKSPKPNVLFIAIDDLNDWIGALGKRQDVQTPNLDRLAKRGVLFTRAYCSAPACNPSRASVLTGVRPSTSGVYHNTQPWRPVLRDAVTLPQYFIANGYHVVGGGKLFHNPFNDPKSWQVYYPPQPSPQPTNGPLNGLKAAQFDWGPVPVGDDEMGDYKVVQWGIDQLKAKHDRPFFLAVGLIRPHLPWYVPQNYFDQYPLDKIVVPRVQANDLDDVPLVGRQMAKPEGDHKKVVEAKQWEKAVQGYLASITFADAQVGRLLNALDASAHAKNTIIVLWSDHGWQLGEKQHWRKFALWEEATRVTFMMVAPGVTQPNQRCERTVSLMDIYPTLTELCGLPEKRGLEATSIVPLLKNPTQAWDHPSVTTHGRDNHAVRSERWRYIRYRDGTEELYDHNVDPLEWTNLASNVEYELTKKQLAGRLPRTNAPEAPIAGKRSDDGDTAKPKKSE